VAVPTVPGAHVVMPVLEKYIAIGSSAAEAAVWFADAHTVVAARALTKARPGGFALEAPLMSNTAAPIAPATFDPTKTIGDRPSRRPLGAWGRSRGGAGEDIYRSGLAWDPG